MALKKKDKYARKMNHLYKKEVQALELKKKQFLTQQDESKKNSGKSVQVGTRNI